MAYNNKCPECGANLDPGEECLCFREHADSISVTTKAKTERNPSVIPSGCQLPLGKGAYNEKAPIEIAVSTGADVKKDIEISISLYYKNSKLSRRRK